MIRRLLQPLIDRVHAERRSFVTHAELNEFLPHEKANPETIEDIMAVLSEIGIDVVEDPDSD